MDADSYRDFGAAAPFRRFPRRQAFDFHLADRLARRLGQGFQKTIEIAPRECRLGFIFRKQIDRIVERHRRAHASAAQMIQ